MPARPHKTFLHNMPLRFRAPSRPKILMCTSFSLMILGFIQFHFDKSNFLSRLDSGYAVANSEACGSDEIRSTTVLQWVRQHGGWIHQNLTVGTFPIDENEYTRGLMAIGNIGRSEEIIRIPSNLLLNLETVRTDPTFRSLYDSVPELHDGLAGLAVYLIYESLNETSFWRPYLCSLPKLVPLPIFYSPLKKAELYAKFNSANLTGGRRYFDTMSRAMRWVVDTKFNKVMPVLFKKYPSMFEEKTYNKARWAWAMSIILSRTWGRPFEDSVITNQTGRNQSNVHTLVPAADMPNHDSSARPAQFRNDGGKPQLVLHTIRHVGPGEQVLISYGNKCDLEFLVNCKSSLCCAFACL
jgi:hypothetical protein